MFQTPHVINDHKKCESVYNDSIRFLEENRNLYQIIAQHLGAYHEIFDLIQLTPTNLFSGHAFPYTESYFELENSYQLSLQGFYRYAFVALRSVLELGLLNIYFAVEDNEHIEVRPWIKSKERTPTLKTIVSRLQQLPAIQAFDKRFGICDRMLKNYDDLGAFVHTRGYRNSSTFLNYTNSNQFQERSLKLYVDMMTAIVRDILIVMLLKYPIGMQGLPLSQKFGDDGPIGLIEQYPVDWITCVIDPLEREFLQYLSNNDPGVQATITAFQDLPDVTEEEREAQLARFKEQFPQEWAQIQAGIEKNTGSQQGDSSLA